MAKDKKSVLLYCDIIHTVEELDDVDAGLLFKHYLRYINDQNPEPPSKLIKIVFEPIKQNLKRDLKKWEEKSVKNSESARIRWDKENANASERIERDANYADKVTVIDTVKVNDKVTDIKIPLRAFEIPFVEGSAVYKAWIEWEQHRKELKKKLTASTAKKQIQFLGGRADSEIIAIINNSITNGWVGLFEINKTNNGNRNNFKASSTVSTFSGDYSEPL